MMDVSVIIPAYNRLWALPKAVESCRGTLCKTEIIVIDDGSTDGTWDWLQTQSDIIAIKQPNWGKCWAVNKAFAKCTGKYVKFLDSDDSIAPGAIDEQFELAEADNSDIVVSGYQVVDENQHTLRQQPWIVCDDYIAQQLGECDSSHYSAYLFKRSFIANVPHRPDFAYRDDRLFVLETALKLPKVSIHAGFALLHTSHSQPKMQGTNGLQRITQNYQHLKIYEKIFNLLAQQNQLTPRRIKAAESTLWNLCKWIASDDAKEAEKLLKWIYELDPEFKIPSHTMVDRIYKTLGISLAQKFVQVKKGLGL